MNTNLCSLLDAARESFPHLASIVSVDNLSSGCDLNFLLDGQFDEYFLRNLLKKCSNIDLGVNPIEEAKTAFLRHMADQLEYDETLAILLSDKDSDPVLHDVLHHARKMFQEVFKDFIPYTLIPRETFGASLTLPKGNNVLNRFTAAEGSKHMNNYVYKVGDSYMKGIRYYESRDDTNHVELDIVPKTAKVGRIIGKHPNVILAYQNALGDFITDMLNVKYDINISKAQALHQALVLTGSGDGWPISTIDLSYASDSINKRLIRFLLSDLPGIYDFISYITPPIIKLDGDTVDHVMMAPAGNGYIFPLQTLLYYCLCSAVYKVKYNTLKHSTIYVYGDDIIVNRDIYDGVINTLKRLGFKPNLSKSFRGPQILESCGTDAVRGINRRALYVKRIPDGSQDTIDWITIANGIRRVAYYNNSNRWISIHFARFWFRICLLIPKEYRVFSPRHYGDAAINTESTNLYRFAAPGTTGGFKDLPSLPSHKPTGYGHGQELPYRSERIFVYVSTTKGTTTWCELSKGIALRKFLSIVSSESLKGSGDFLRDGKYVHRNYLMRKHTGYELRPIPYTITGSPPDDIDDLFNTVANRGFTVELALERYQRKLFSARTDLIFTLKRVLSNRKQLLETIRSTQLTLD